jgi:hypothetical protein
MSYPDLGCFAECLECELCENPSSTDDDSDFDPFDFGDLFEPGEPWDDPGFWDPDDSGDYDDGGLFDDFPTGVPIGDTELSPSWSDGPGLNWSGEF